MTNQKLLGKFELIASKLALAERDNKAEDVEYYEEVLLALEKEILKRMENK